MPIAFSKMHGIGNDFVVIDRRRAPVALGAEVLRAMADRHTGIGFDQLLTLESLPGTDVGYRIWNTDGSEARQCGNGVRCLVAWLARDGALADAGTITLQGPAGAVHCRHHADGSVEVDMGEPVFAPAAVPFAADADRPAHELGIGDERVEVGVVSMGNPHAVLEVDDLARAEVARLGAAIERHPRFPERCNVGFAEVRGRESIGLRVFERGVGETRACGSGACAAVAVLSRRGRVGAEVAVTLPGGTLHVTWPGPGRRLGLRGPASFVYEGTWPT